MSYREFTQWAAWNAHSPIGDERCHDLGPALIRQMHAQMNSKRGSKFPLEDFLPFARRDEPQNVNEAEAALIAWAKANGTRERR